MMKWLLLLMPLAVVLEHTTHGRPLLVFAVAAAGIIPLAAFMAQATGSLAVRLGPALGGLLNATFGNAAELIIALTALRAGLHDMVKASIAGTIIGNILLVLGIAMVLGGSRHGEQSYDARAARTQATMLTLAVMALILPAAYRSIVPDADTALDSISAWIAIALLVVYVANVAFTIVQSRKASARLQAEFAAEYGATRRQALRATAAQIGMVLVGLALLTLGARWLNDAVARTTRPAPGAAARASCSSVRPP